MRRFLLVFALLTALQALNPDSAAAQASWSQPTYNFGSGWCVGCYQLANIDGPNISTPWTGTLAGWSFWCSTGELLQRADVYYWKPGASLVRAKTHLRLTHLPRPDVERFFASTGGCPAVPSDSGWQIAFDEPIPPGTWVMSVVFWHGNVSTTQSGLVVVPDAGAR